MGIFWINDEIYNVFIKQPGFNSWKVSGTPVLSVIIPRYKLKQSRNLDWVTSEEAPFYLDLLAFSVVGKHDIKMTN